MAESYDKKRERWRCQEREEERRSEEEAEDRYYERRAQENRLDAAIKNAEYERAVSAEYDIYCAQAFKEYINEEIGTQSMTSGEKHE